jgi:hypothetical protein
MKKFGLSLEIPSSDEEKGDQNEQPKYESGDDMVESEEQESSKNSQNGEFEQQESENESDILDRHDDSKDDIPLISKPILGIGSESTEKHEKPSFKFGGLKLDVEDGENDDESKHSSHNESKNSSHNEESKHSQQEEPAYEELTDELKEEADDGIQIEGCESTGDISYKWVEALKNIQIVERGVQFNQFYKNYALRAISQEFKLIRKLTETKIHMSQISKREKGKDRYRDLGPFKHTQIKLRSKDKAFDTSVDNYINANNIRSAKLRNLFIATQGPLDNGFLNFWRMIWQEKVSIIFMLCPLKEGEKKK